MRTHALPLFVITLLAAGCGGGEFSGGSAGAPGDDASVQPDGSAGTGGQTGTGGNAGVAGSAGTAGAAGQGGTQDASTDVEAGPACSGAQKLCGTVCVDTSSNPEHCGECDNACASNMCKSGQCVPDCGTSTNCGGACVDVSTDLNHCGQCDNVCPAKANQTPSCTSGQCSVECNEPWADCNGVADDGCEANLDTNPSTCGTCSQVCSYANAKPACDEGACVLEACNTGFGTCDGLVENGCETDFLHDPNNCGDCNNKCAPVNGVGICNQGKCEFKECLAGFADCDNSLANGCETAISSDEFNCGACGRACSTYQVASRECTAGVCTSSCLPWYDNVTTPTGGTPDDGCEIQAVADTRCGSVANDCSKLGFSGSVMHCVQMQAPPACGCTEAAQCGYNGSNSVTCEPGARCRCSATKEPCNFGETCVAFQGIIACRCNGNTGCGNNQICCAGGIGCVSSGSDPNNCGACGHKCPSGFACSTGMCQCSGNASCNAGSAGTCGQGVCQCGGTTCQPGQRCLSNGTCG